MERVRRATGGCVGRGKATATVVVIACLLGAAVSSWAAAAAPTVRYRPADGWRTPPGPPSPSQGVSEGPDGAGDTARIVLIAFSGRCALTSCTPPDDNEDALARALVPAVVAALSQTGHRVEAWTYRAHTDDDPVRGRGYRSADADLERAVQDGIVGHGSSARLVLLGYSHGTQFAHLLAFEHPEVAFAASVLLDSICLGFDADHAARLVATLAPGAGPWAASGPYHVGCDVLSIPGLVGHLDLGDVVPWNVARSLEVRSGGQVLGVVRDVRSNVRPDGTPTGIEVLDLPSLRHQASDEPDGAAFAAWVAWTLEVVGSDP